MVKRGIKRLREGACWGVYAVFDQETRGMIVGHGKVPRERNVQKATGSLLMAMYNIKSKVFSGGSPLYARVDIRTVMLKNLAH